MDRVRETLTFSAPICYQLFDPAKEG